MRTCSDDGIPLSTSSSNNRAAAAAAEEPAAAAAEEPAAAAAEEPAAAAAEEPAAAAAEEFAAAAAANAEEPVEYLNCRPAAMRLAKHGGVNLFNDNFEWMMQLRQMLIDAIDNNGAPRVRRVQMLLIEVVDFANVMMAVLRVPIDEPQEPVEQKRMCCQRKKKELPSSTTGTTSTSFGTTDLVADRCRRPSLRLQRRLRIRSAPREPLAPCICLRMLYLPTVARPGAPCLAPRSQ